MQRGQLYSLLLVCVVTLVLAQALAGMLSFAALQRQAAENTAERVEIPLRQSAAHIQMGLQLGKPLAQYFGLDSVLSSLHHRVPDMLGASVVLGDGQVLASVGRLPDAHAALTAIHEQTAMRDQTRVRPPLGTVRQFFPDAVRLAIALVEPGVASPGILVVEIEAPSATRQGPLSANILVLTGIALGIPLLLFVHYRKARAGLQGNARLRKLIPVLFLVVGQAMYAAWTINSFRAVWQEVARENAGAVAEGVKRDLERVMSFGITPDKLVGADIYLMRTLRSFPVIKEMRLLGSDETMLVHTSHDGVLPTQEEGSALTMLKSSAHIRIPLYLYAAAGPQPVASLEAVLDPVLLRAGLWVRVLDAGVITVVASVMAFELLVLFELALHAFRSRRSESMRRRMMRRQETRMALWVRPLMFGFVFAWALPLGFLPLHTRSLIPYGTDPAVVGFLVALPVVVEMGSAMIAALLVGRSSQRYGWQYPVLSGLLISVCASVLCAFVSSYMGFVATRSLVGVGYGLASMGLQGLVVLQSPTNARGRNMAGTIAGLYAGHLSGIAIGAMLMQQFGAMIVFQSGALLFILPVLGVLVVAGLYGRLPRAEAGMAGVKAAEVDAAMKRTVGRRAVSIGSVASASLIAVEQQTAWTLLFSRDFGFLLLASVIPFAIAQVGLLSFIMPLYLEADGFEMAAVGRIMMAYGLCVIYLGPAMGRRADRSSRKKHWIAVAGFVGSAGLIGFSVFGGAAGAVLAVVCLALASCLANGAQIGYMLGLKNVKCYGVVAATSLMGAVQKVGQMLGPLIMASLLAITSMPNVLLLIGVVYLLASVTFLLVAPDKPDRLGSNGVPEG